MGVKPYFGLSGISRPSTKQGTGTYPNLLVPQENDSDRRFDKGSSPRRLNQRISRRNDPPRCCPEYLTAIGRRVGGGADSTGGRREPSARLGRPPREPRSWARSRYGKPPRNERRTACGSEHSPHRGRVVAAA